MRGSDVGFPDTFKGYNPKYYSLLTILDSLFASLVLSPCVVGYWRSVWTLMDIYVYPKNEWLSAVVSTAIGFGGHLFFSLSQKVFKEHFHPSKNRLLYYVVSRLYTLCFAFVCVNGWRGPWHMLDIHAKKKFFTVLVTTMVGIVALISIRGLRNVSATPFIVVNDKIKGYFEVITMFRISVENMGGLFILDCLFSILIVGTLVVFVWRGSWTLVDIFLFPDDRILSSWGSLVVGYVTVAMAFCLQPLARHLCETLSGTPRLLVSDFLHIFALFGTVNIWRGIWNLLDIYFIPDNPELSCWITHWVSFLMLILLGCSNSLLVRGVYIDAEEPDGKCVEFPCYYLRVIFRKDKLRKMKLKTTNSEDKNEKPVETIVNTSVIQKNIMENSSPIC